jgi:protein-tyrosine phosphatase
MPYSGATRRIRMSDPTAFEIKFDPTQQRMSGYTRIGNAYFDVPFISELDDNLWQGGCQSGLVLPTFIKHLVSLYPWERYDIHNDLHSSLSVVMYDSEDQAFNQVDAIASWVNACREDGVTLVHCQAGLNRSSLVAARALMLAGKTADEAITQVRERRSPVCLINPSFARWLRER